MNFFDASFLWKEAVISSVLLAAACAMAGVYAILRRVVFLPAALSQFSGFGVMFAFALTEAAHATHGDGTAIPLAASFCCGIGGAVLLGWKEERSGSRESFIGIVWVLSSAFIVLIAGAVPQESYHVEDLIFGNAVVVAPSQMWTAIFASGAVILLHVLGRSVFMFVSFDEETAGAHGLPTRLINALLFGSMGLIIATTTKTIGALPAFAFAILPGCGALRLFSSTGAILAVAGVSAGLCAFAGYWISFARDLPTGACAVTVTGTMTLLMTGIAEFHSRCRNRV